MHTLTGPVTSCCRYQVNCPNSTSPSDFQTNVLTHAIHASGATHVSCVHEVRIACRRHGFETVTGHGSTCPSIKTINCTGACGADPITRARTPSSPGRVLCAHVLPSMAHTSAQPTPHRPTCPVPQLLVHGQGHSIPRIDTVVHTPMPRRCWPRPPCNPSLAHVAMPRRRWPTHHITARMCTCGRSRPPRPSRWRRRPSCRCRCRRGCPRRRRRR